MVTDNCLVSNDSSSYNILYTKLTRNIQTDIVFPEYLEVYDIIFSIFFISIMLILSLKKAMKQIHMLAC